MAQDNGAPRSAADKAKLLLHVCCAPCATAVIERLQADYDLVLFWHNPNITDPNEHEQRLAEFRRYAERVGLDSVVGAYSVGAWQEAVTGLEAEPEGGRRCGLCFRVRLEAAARAARTAGIPLFTTTLSISPHKSFEQVRAAGEEAAAQTGTEFLPIDFKKQGGFQRSAELATQHALYRQDYCGCEFSKRERDQRRSRRASRHSRQEESN